MRKRSRKQSDPVKRIPPGRKFIESEAQAEGDTGDESEEEEQEDDQGGRQFLVPDDRVEPSSPSEHRRVDATLRERDAESLQPYFPLAFAVSDDRPLEFNFDLFLLDSLSLSRDISERGREEESTPQEVTFDSAAAAIQYCRERLERGWKATRPSPATQRSHRASNRLSHPDIDKWQLFRRDGSRIRRILRSGHTALDENLNLVRVDRSVLEISNFGLT